MEKSRVKLNKNTSRSKTFGIVINPKILNEKINWSTLSENEVELKLQTLNFPNKYQLTGFLNNVEFENTNKNKTKFEDFEGQLEIGDEIKIPHYQLAVLTETICTKKSILEAFQKNIEGLINIEIQFNFEEMRKYCNKETTYISEEYSGKIYKQQWKLSFLEQVLSREPEDRIINWIIDPVGNCGKSSFARAYLSTETTDGLLIKIDNLDRMELSFLYLSV